MLSRGVETRLQRTGQEERRTQMSAGSGKRARVLVVEDEPEVLRVVQTILEEAGMQVTGAWGGGGGSAAAARGAV